MEWLPSCMREKNLIPPRKVYGNQGVIRSRKSKDKQLYTKATS